MTRETKIGLLVGLSFIIVIGILLSDHLTTRGELPAAQLTQVGPNVRTSNTVPASTNPPITPVTVPSNVVPTGPVATHDELNTRPPTAIVQVGAPTRDPVVVSTEGISVDVGPVRMASGLEPAVTRTPTKDDHFGQPLMVTDAKAPSPSNPADDMKPVSPNQSLAVVNNPTLKEVTAEKGDTVSHFAAKYLGSNTTANRQLIIDANPALKADPAKIIIGRKYLIPTKPATAVAMSTPAIPDTVPTNDLSTKPEVKKAETKTAAKSTSHTTYTVKSNDTLWDIANGSPSLIKEIQELNKDVLKGKTIVHPGTVLKIPAKGSVASS